MAERKARAGKPDREDELTQEITEGTGAVSISKDVITTIAGLAAAEIEGVMPPKGGTFKKSDAVKRLVDTTIEGGEVKVSMRISALYGHALKAVAEDLQERIKADVERMTGLAVRTVDVEIVRLVFADEADEGLEN